MNRLSTLVALSALATACTQVDGDGLAFASDASSMRAVVDGTDDATIVLYLANTLDQDALDDEVGLDSRAAANVLSHRAGSDGVAGTADDETIDDMDELDAISYVGDSALLSLLAFGTDVRGMTGEDVFGVLVGSYEAEAMLWLANHLGEDALDNDVALDSRAAANLVTDRAAGDYTTLDELDAVSYVASSAFGKLLSFADSNGMLAGEGLAVRGGVAYNTLTDANDLGTGTSIYLYAGTYAGTSSVDQTLFVYGYDVERTVLSGGGSTRALEVDAGSPCFYDLTISDGAGTDGAGAYLTTAGSVVFDNVDFVDNSATGKGAAIYADAATLTLNEAFVASNTSVNGAIYIDGAGSLTITDSLLSDNTSSSPGGAVYTKVDTTIDNSEFDGNHAFYGAAVFAFAVNAHLEMTDSRVANNTHTSSAAGAVELPYTVELSNVDFYANEVDVYDYRASTGNVKVDGLGYGTTFSCDSATCTGL